MSIEINTDGIEFSVLRRKLSDPSPLYKIWATIGEREIVKSFKEERSPLGIPWQPLNPQYLAYKRRYKGKRGKPRFRGAKILRWTNQLYDSIYGRSDRTGAEVGAGYKVRNADIGAVHNFGTRRIARRQFIPADDRGNPTPALREQLIEAAIDYLRD